MAFACRYFGRTNIRAVVSSNYQIPSFVSRCLSSGTNNSDMPPVPERVERHGESLEIMKARLLYQSRKRGMLENGLLLSSFAAKFLSGMSEAQTVEYDSLINKPSNDWDIYYWATGNKPTPTEFQGEVMDMLKEHAQNKDMDSRIRQPDL